VGSVSDVGEAQHDRQRDQLGDQLGATPASLRFRSLPRGAQRFLVGTLVNMMGNGLQFAFLFIYFTDVRKFSGAAAGWLVACTWGLMVFTSSTGGALVDRFGSRAVLVASVLVTSAVASTFGWVTTMTASIIIAVAYGGLNGIMMPAQQAFTAQLVPSEQRPVVSSWLRIMLNIGAGIGATIGGFIADADRPWTFTLLFGLNGVTFVLYAIIIVTVKDRFLVDQSIKSNTQGRYRDVLKDAFYARLLPIDFASGAMFGLAFMVMPTTFIKRLGASEFAVGMIVMSGTVAVIASQLAIARWVRGRARMRTLAIMFGLFFACFLFGVASVGRSLGLALALVVVAQLVGGVGESCLGPTRNPLTAEVAPAQLLGRYFGLQSVMFSAGFGLGIAGGGASLDVSMRGVWIGGAGLALAALMWSIRLDRLIPAAVRLSP
jgi:MFS family permease